LNTVYKPSDLIADDIDAYLVAAPAQEPAALHHLRLGGRRQVDPDRPAALRQQDDLRGPAGGPRGRLQAGRHAGRNIDFALLVDGLAAEREQGITIDVAYRFFATDKRKFIVADTPGHEQYTRNMVTGASTADAP
jgi:bifunctional enzyme CysN/CysC